MQHLLMPTVVALAAQIAPVAGQDAGTDRVLALQLDSLSQAGASCRLTFVARNGLEEDLEAFVLEAVAFDREGGVARIALFDFGALPAGSPRVRQFDLPDIACDAVESVLVNGIDACEGVADCAERLSVTSRAEAELIE